jgi:hypothetical protein
MFARCIVSGLMTIDEALNLDKRVNIRIIKQGHEDCGHCLTGSYRTSFLKMIIKSIKRRYRPQFLNVPQSYGLDQIHCPICYSDFSPEGPPIYKIHESNHFFCVKCLDTWFNSHEDQYQYHESVDYTCPLCNVKI